MALIRLGYWEILVKEQRRIECSIQYRNYFIYGHCYYVSIYHVFKKSKAKRLANLVRKALKQQ